MKHQADGIITDRQKDIETVRHTRQMDRQTMYPVTGASGGATRSPLLSMPTMLVSRDPCHSNILPQRFIIKTITERGIFKKLKKVI